MYYNKCPICGSNNDPGEHCECEKAFNYQQHVKKQLANVKKSDKSSTKQYPLSKPG